MTIQTAKKILIVDDETAVVKAMQEQLEQSGFEVIVATDGEAGWQMVQTESVQLIIIDIIMPHKDGLWLLGQLKKCPEASRVPVIVSTNLFGGEKVEQMVALGVHKVITKDPASIAQLSSVVKEVLLAHGQP